MQAALRSVARLHVTVEQRITVSGSRVAAAEADPLRPPEVSAASLVAVVSTALELFASAVPNLQSLVLQYGCQESVTRAFGPRCPQLSSLEVDTCSVPASALHSISEHLPCLTNLTLRGTGEHSSRQQTDKGGPTSTGSFGHIEAILASLQQCNLLTVIRIEHDGCIENQATTAGGDSDTACWVLAPALEELVYNCGDNSKEMPAGLWGRLKRLTLPGGDSSFMNTLATHLEQLIRAAN
ncbi:MAG: hypothetical protein WDW38_002421 [Sanguina aurantia]